MFPSETTASYTNPVYKGSFPDPFVIKFRGEYFAYCTGFAPDGRVFGVLNSPDLVNWNELSGAMTPLDSPHPHYWAPEVSYQNGKFYLYYSVGNETLMEIRVAVADRPDGDFRDTGRRLSKEEFAIDPHVFRDDDGSWHMFYATDFLTHSHIGTGTVLDGMVDQFTLVGRPRPVTRARYDWQVYDPARREKGGVRWHTVEGPFVLKRKGLYYEMFSGGNWQNETYGVSFAVSDGIEKEDEWEQFSDGTKTLPVLRTIPGRIRGPGHNSVVRGPNNREFYCVYHVWSDAGRVLAIDRMDFSGPGQMFVIGPTDMPEPAPYTSTGSSSQTWQVVSGNWALGTYLTSGADVRSEISQVISHAADLRCCFSWKSIGRGGTFGVSLKAGDIDLFTCLIDQQKTNCYAEWSGSGGQRTFPLYPDFDLAAVHEVIMDVDGETVSIGFDGEAPTISADLSTKPTAISLFSEGVKVEFGPVEITSGFEELFQFGDILKRGWDHYANSGSLIIKDGILRMEGKGEDRATITRNVVSTDHELCLNVRFESNGGGEPSFNFGCGNMFGLTIRDRVMFDSDGQMISLPEAYDPGAFHQFRVVRRGTGAKIYLDAVQVGTVSAIDGEFIRIMAKDGIAELDMVRYTLI